MEDENSLAVSNERVLFILGLLETAEVRYDKNKWYSSYVIGNKAAYKSLLDWALEIRFPNR